jgi:hypothetical protein
LLGCQLAVNKYQHIVHMFELMLRAAANVVNPATPQSFIRCALLINHHTQQE